MFSKDGADHANGSNSNFEMAVGASEEVSTTQQSTRLCLGSYIVVAKRVCLVSCSTNKDSGQDGENKEDCKESCGARGKSIAIGMVWVWAVTPM